MNNITFDFLRNHPQHAHIITDYNFYRWRQRRPNLNYDKVHERTLHHMNYDRLPLAYLALDNDKLAGMCLIKDGCDCAHELAPWIYSLFVKEEYRNQGIAKTLLKMSLDTVKSFSYSSCYAFTLGEELISWYRTMSWSHIMNVKRFDEDFCIIEYKF